MPIDTPVVLIIFRRPETTRRVFEAIREARPKQFFIVADGPRPDIQGEEEKCRAARDVVADIDWDCEVYRNYADENMGLQRRVVTGLDWVFDEVDRATILEDDCVPDPSFFPFCAELLDYYEDDSHIMTISGNNFQPERRTKYSYYFSRYMHCWGWATWKRAWEHFDLDMRNWPEVRGENRLEEIFDTKAAAAYWRNIFDRVSAGKIDSWAYVWQYCIWAYNGLNILPEQNLVSNIGFGEEATHTKRANDESAALSLSGVEFPLSHPPFIIRHATADRYTQSRHFQRPFHRRVSAKVRRMIGNISGGVGKHL